MNITKEYDFTIIVPIYNEEDNMERLEKELTSYLNIAPVKTCVLIINDGSKDNSLQIIKECCNRHDSFFYISSIENHGLSTAIKVGFDYVESRYVGYIDSDLQKIGRAHV